MNKIYGFDKNKNKYEVFPKNDFVILKSEYFFKTNTATTQMHEHVMHHIKFPDESWNQNNTRILEARTTLYTKKNDGTFYKNISKIVGDSQIDYINGTYSASWLEAKISITPDGYSSMGQEADIYYYHNEWGTIGDKEVLELLIMKVDIEED